jgi:hypothetical protein
VAEQSKAKLSWVERRREKKRLERERTGPSPEKLAERARKSGPPPEEVSGLEALGSPRNMWQRQVGRKPND